MMDGMPRYIVTTRSAKRGEAAAAKDAVSGVPGVRVLGVDDPDIVTIETSEPVAKDLKAKLFNTHIVEPEIRRSLH